MDQLSLQKTNTAWTRSGCITCKRRRKRCDKTKPTCRNCTRLGRVCEGYTSLWTEPLNPSASVFQSEGPKRRRICLSPSSTDRVVESRVSPVSNSGSLSSSVSDSLPGSFSYEDDTRSDGTNESLDSYQGSGNSSKQLNWDASPIIDINLGKIQRSHDYNHLPTPEIHYLQYHIEQGSKLLANLETDENPLRSLIIPRALSSPLLMKAVCAVSAMHLANRSHSHDSTSTNTGTAAANYYIRTLRELRTTLSEQPDSPFREDTMLAVAFLCKYEIVRGSVKQWAVHLEALQKLVVSRGGFASIDQDTAEFLWGMFMYAHNVAKITNRRHHLAAITTAPNNISLTKLDSYVGYTEELIKLCARISDIPFLGDDSLSIGLEVHSIDEALQKTTQKSKSYIIPKGTTQGTLHRLQTVAACFHDATYIYLHSTIDRITQKSSTHEVIAASCKSLISTTKESALRRCLARIDSSRLDENHCEYSALTFPLFIAGCECVSLTEREVVVRSLGLLERNFAIGNVRRVRELLMVLWGRDDDHEANGGKGKGHWLDVLEVLDWDLILA